MNAYEVSLRSKIDDTVDYQRVTIIAYSDQEAWSLLQSEYGATHTVRDFRNLDSIVIMSEGI